MACENKTCETAEVKDIFVPHYNVYHLLTIIIVKICTVFIHFVCFESFLYSSMCFEFLLKWLTKYSFSTGLHFEARKRTVSYLYYRTKGRVGII